MAAQDPTPVVKLDSYTPAEMEEKAEAAGVTKANLSFRRCFLLAIAAGGFIGFGGMYFCIVLADPNLSFAIKKVLGGLTFCLGLALVLVAGAELFTGNSLMVLARASGKITTPQMLRNWVIVWFGNLVGSVGLVFLAYLAHEWALNNNGIEKVMLGVALGKVNLPIVTLFFKAILCNLMVCLAVWLGYACRTVTDKVVVILLPISGFVAAGFEHSVANMYFLPFGLLLKLTGHVPAGMDVSSLTFGSVAYNISVVTIGNIVGGALFVGMLYWLAFRKELSKSEEMSRVRTPASVSTAR